MPNPHTERQPEQMRHQPGNADRATGATLTQHHKQKGQPPSRDSRTDSTEPSTEPSTGTRDGTVTAIEPRHRYEHRKPTATAGTLAAVVARLLATPCRSC